MNNKDKFIDKIDKRIKTLNILDIQKKEIKNYIKKNVTDRDLNTYSPEEYLNKILKIFGKNNYNSYILLNSLNNFLMLSTIIFLLINFRMACSNYYIININLLSIISIITFLIYPISKIVIRKELLKDIKGSKILKKVIFYNLPFIAMISIIYFNNLFSIQISINKKIFSISVIILLIVLNIILSRYKFDKIKK
ncbi:MAG: hypothetical protein ACQEQE_01685 [Bacillota bacterium]